MLQSVEELRCDAVADRLEALVDGDLEQGEEALMRRHLDRCAACRDDLRAAVEVRDALRAMPVFVPARSVCRPLLAAAASSGGSVRRFAAVSARRNFGLAAAAAAAVLTIALLSRHASPPAVHDSSGSAARAAAEAKYAVALLADVGRIAEQRLEQQLVDSQSLAKTVRGVSVPLRWLRRAQTVGLKTRSDDRADHPGGA